MEINKICFYNIGFSDKISDDYFDNTHVDFSTEMDKPTPGVQIK